MANGTPSTHEQYLHHVRRAVIADALRRNAITRQQGDRLGHAKLLYGLGDGTYRGVCHYDAWENGIGHVDVIEIAATAQESWIQLAGTVVHELGHILAGWNAGHGPDWKTAAQRLGFSAAPEAAGQTYRLAMLRPAIRHAVYTLASEIGDGHPHFQLYGPGGPTITIKPRPCSAGIGTRGGTSRGKGSGSRMRLWECQCPKPIKVRVASDDFQATCNRCGTAFTRPDLAQEAA
jgi:hypothetical protein